MFESATLKLTFVYVLFLATICAFFSANWYNIATRELERSVVRQEVLIEQRPKFRGDPFFDELKKDAEKRLEEGRSAIVNRLVVTNAVIIGLGSIGSYWLARRTLRPIEEAHLEQLRFTADASHELRTPLTAMRTEIDVTLRDKKLSKQSAVKQLESTREELERMTSLSEQLLKLARQDEQTSLATHPTRVDALVNKAVENVLLRAKHKQITITQNVSNALAEAHADSVTEILCILLDNAIKYSPKKSAIHINTEVKRGATLISVVDQGVGISQQDQRHIFDRFYRADNSRTGGERSGHGLGLSIAHQITSNHPNAELSVHSDGKGTGSTFTLSLKTATIKQHPKGGKNA